MRNSTICHKEISLSNGSKSIRMDLRMEQKSCRCSSNFTSMIEKKLRSLEQTHRPNLQQNQSCRRRAIRPKLHPFRLLISKNLSAGAFLMLQLQQKAILTQKWRLIDLQLYQLSTLTRILQLRARVALRIRIINMLVT